MCRFGLRLYGAEASGEVFRQPEIRDGRFTAADMVGDSDSGDGVA